jgi:CheY-like chemotaxis protein
MKGSYNFWILATLFWVGALLAAPPEEGRSALPNSDGTLPFPTCREQMALRAFQLNELFLGSRSAQISMLERQLSQLAILVDDWKSIPLGGSYFEAMAIRRGILVGATKQMIEVLKRIGTLSGATKEDKITVHDILNIFDIAVKSAEDVMKIDYDGDETLEKSFGFITAIMYSRLHRELAIISEVLLRTNIHASYFHDTRPRTIKEKISIATACQTITKLFPNFVSCSGILSDKNAQELIIEIDMQSVIGSLANLNKNAKEAFMAYHNGDTSIPYEPNIHVHLVTPMQPFASQMTIDEKKGTGSRTFVFGEQAPNTSYLVISLVDKAGGMPLDKFPRLLERGNTGHAEAERGIGLFSVGREVERHRGVVHVLTNLSTDDRPVGGSEVSLYFPLPEKEEPKPVAETKTPTIFIIDDDRSIHLVLKTFLSKIIQNDPDVPEDKRGYALAFFKSRSAAIRAIQDGSAGTPKIIITDFMTSEGDATMEQLGELAKELNVPIGRMSAISMGTPGATVESFPLPEGYSFELTKPAVYSDIRATILDLLADPEELVPPMPIPSEPGS